MGQQRNLLPLLFCGDISTKELQPPPFRCARFSGATGQDIYVSAPFQNDAICQPADKN